MPSHHHRASGLRQSNKRNKRSKASKRSLSRAAGGKIVGGPVNAARRAAVTKSKADRRHLAQQKREASRQALIRKKRSSGGAAAPRIVGIISLGESRQVEQTLLKFLLQSADKVVADETKSSVTAKYNVHKKDGTLSYLVNSPQDDDEAVMAALDLCRICSVVLFVIDGNGPQEGENLMGMQIGGDASISTKSSSSGDWDHLISERGDLILAAIKAQGLPTPLTILAHTMPNEPEDYMTMQSAKSVRRSALKRRTDLKRYVSRFAATEFGQDHDKVMEVDLTQEVDQSAAVVRTLCNMSSSPAKWVADTPRSYLVAEQKSYDSEAQELQVTGFVRGTVPFDVNALIHVPNMGTYCVKHVQKASNPLFRRKGDEMDDHSNDALWSDPRKRDSLEMFATPDALEGEQNLIGFDEDMNDFEEEEEEKGIARPAGWSDYQSAWLDAVDEGDTAADDIDHGELAKALNQKSTPDMNTDMDLEVSAEERKALLEQRRKDLKEDLEFPDEVEIQEEINARDRLARYRSLKSFRKSYWDPKENLPESYGSIYHFSNFKATQRDVTADMKDVAKVALDGDFWGASSKVKNNQEGRMEEDTDEEEQDLLDGCIPSGSYATVTIEKVPAEDYARISCSSLVTAVTLLPHENKVSVMHMGLSQSAKCNQSDIPIKSKDVLTFRCGWRTWKARPVFSQNNLNSDKHKFERFLPQGGAFFAASVFGPVTYAPCPVLVFRESSNTDTSEGGEMNYNRELVAIGSMLGADADRIVIKRVILTGYPVRVHKRHATVKYMFYNPDDVNWFKPAGLTTKHGLHGNIIESVGEHGTMKCLFNAPIKQHDTVCLPLYKRMYPKFAPDVGNDDSGTVSKPGLVVL